MKRIELSTSRKGIPALRCRYHATPPCPRLVLISASRYMLARIGIMWRNRNGALKRRTTQVRQNHTEEFDDRNIRERRTNSAHRIRQKINVKMSSVTM